MSRSVDDSPAVNLDSQARPTNQVAFDRNQVSGSQGDTYDMGGISLNPKDNTITLNDGTLHVNDTTTSSSIQASSGNITYFDSSGNLVVQEGILPDGATGIKIVDKQQIGLAQFGRFKDGTTALKVAKPNIEVSTARDDQLIFNSSQNMFKIIKTDTLNVTLTNVANTVSAGTQTTTIPHLLNYSPAFLVYITAPSGFVDGNALLQLPHVSHNTITGLNYVFTRFYATVDTSSLYIKWIHVSNTDYSPDVPAFTVRYYLLQETAN